MKESRLFLVALSLFFISAVMNNAETVETNDEAIMVKPESEQRSLDSISGTVDAEHRAVIDGKRGGISQEAIEAISETRKALKLLDDNNAAESMKMLEKIVGKLEILLAKNPELDLIPINSKVSVSNIFTDLESIEIAKREAIRLLKEGDVQKARRLLQPLVSEMKITMTYIPMASYPQAIKRVVPLVDGGEIKSARDGLSQALSTLVVETNIIPLPPLNAKHLLRQAQKRSREAGTENRQEILELIENARYQLKMAEALGYGEIEEDYEVLHRLIDKTEKRVLNDETSGGIFDDLKKAVSDFSDKVMK